MPFAAPLPPDVTVIQLALLVAVHPQPAPDKTVTLAAPPEDVALGLVGDTMKVHAGSCVTKTVDPATFSVPVRVLDAAFAATV